MARGLINQNASYEKLRFYIQFDFYGLKWTCYATLQYYKNQSGLGYRLFKSLLDSQRFQILQFYSGISKSEYLKQSCALSNNGEVHAKK